MYLVYNEQTGDFEEKLYKDPPELSFNLTNSRNSVFKGDRVHLTWTVKDAEKVDAPWWIALSETCDRSSS